MRGCTRLAFFGDIGLDPWKAASVAALLVTAALLGSVASVAQDEAVPLAEATAIGAIELLSTSLVLIWIS